MSEPMMEDLKKAVKLFNRWQFQEASDAFRQLADEADGKDRNFLQGISELASGFYRIWHKGGEPNAMVNYLQKGITTLKPFDKGAVGISAVNFHESLDRCLDEAMRWRRGDSEIFNRDFIPRLDIAGGEED